MYNFLIRESAFSATPSVLKHNPNTVEFIAVLQEADVPNRNGRIYYKKVLTEALESPYVQERLRTKSFYLEAGHPLDTSVQRQMTIDQRNIAAILLEYWWEGNLLKGRLETANTAVGRDMKGLIEQGSRVAFSLRAQGNVHFDPAINATVVQSPIQIATYDWVVNPSHDKAFLESICEETTQSLFKGDVLTNNMILAESVNLYENGSLIPTEKAAVSLLEDYTASFGQKVKPIKDVYVFREGDELTSIEGLFATLKNGEVTKKVVLEDFLLKDIRNKIANLIESDLGDEAVEPVHDDEEPTELAPEVENEDTYPVEEHEQAEEVKEVIVEEFEDKTDLGDEAVEPVHDDEEPVAETPEVENEDTFPEDEHEQTEELEEVVVESKKYSIKPGQSVREAILESLLEEFEGETDLGDEAVEPVHDDEEPVELAPETENEDTFPEDEHEQAEEVKEVIVEEFEGETDLGDEAVEPVHDDEEPVELQPEIENEDTFPEDEHEQAEEVEEVIVESELLEGMLKKIKGIKGGF
jgi:hypothetical protein